METLYQKYRPQKFAEILEQNHIKLTLGNEIERNKISHAYLFCGPRGVGKTTVARVFSKSVNCLNRKEIEHEPCGECVSCQNISAGKSIDIVEIDAASHTGVDNVRENIISVARMSPAHSKYRVFIIDEVHMLSPSAFNALLKVMEEPPENIIFILCTTEVHKIPETVISRCQRFDFRKISIKGISDGLEMVAKSEGVEINRDILEDIARHSGGHMRDAKGLLGQVIAVGGAKITRDDADLIIPRSDLDEVLKLIEFIAANNAADAIELLNKLIEDGVDINLFSKDLVEVLRKMMLASISPALMERARVELGESAEIKLIEINKKFTTNKLILILDKFIKAKNAIKENFIAQLPLEIAITELCVSKTQLNENKLSGYVAENVNYASKNTKTKPDNPPQKAEEQKNIKDSLPQKNSISSPLKIGKNVIMEKWNEVLVLVKKYNYSLVSILGACEPSEVLEGKLVISFKYKFHKERIDNPEIASSIERVLREVYGQDIKVLSVVDEKLEVKSRSILKQQEEKKNKIAPANNAGEKKLKEKTNASNMLDDLLNTFGGKVIN